MALRPRIRFDVFKRDDFTCQYCGRKPPAVVLEVDHILPVSEGGDDDYENLTTACWDCNRGKGAELLTEGAPASIDLEAKADLIRERERQIRAYNEAKSEERNRREVGFKQVWHYWFEAWGTDELPRWHTPWESSLRKYVGLLGTAEVLDAIDVTRARFDWVSSNAVRYFIGVLKWKLVERENRLRTCMFCGKRIEISEEERDSEELGDDGTTWHHTSCAEEAGA